MKGIKWKSIIIAIIFILSLSLVLIDSVKMMNPSNSYTLYGAITGFIAVVTCLFSYEYLEAEMEK